MPKSRLKSLILGLVLSLASVFAGAAGFYTGTAPVASQSDQDRAAALRLALSQAVTQAAKGDAAVLKRPEVARALTRAERYARQYTYQPNNTPPEPGKPLAKFLLVAQFDSAQIDALVRDQGLVAVPAGAPAPAGTANALPAAAPAGAATPTGTTAPPLANAAVDGTPAAAPADASAATGTGGTYRLWFSGLRSAEDYARLVGALSASPEVRALRVEQAHGSVLQARIEARGSLQSLTDSLDAARLAHTSNTKPPVDGVDAVLDFEP
jgi:hypothetical protein